MSAVLSDDGRYRYRLMRHVAPLTGEGCCTFVMLNPSTADATEDDPTIRRCIAFAQRWGFARLQVVNLYAYRATKPADLWAADDPVGPDNDGALADALRVSDLIVCAWGANAKPDRVSMFDALFPGYKFAALGVTKDGAPRHPLYMRGNETLIPYQVSA